MKNDIDFGKNTIMRTIPINTDIIKALPEKYFPKRAFTLLFYVEYFYLSFNASRDSLTSLKWSSLRRF